MAKKVFDTQDDVDRYNLRRAIPQPKLKTACKRCDTTGGVQTYANQATMPISGKVVCVDWCIHHIVAAPNAGGVSTVACCCGHGKQDGRIDLEDGRVLIIKREAK